ncbi:MAG: ABC transporter permease, partial [Bacteroidales bacterium]
MIANIIKVAFRNLFKHFGYSFINILGLAIGLASTIFIFLYVINELTYDRFHEKSDRIYRAWILGNMPGTEMRHAVTSPPMMEAMLMDYPEVESAVRLRQMGGRLVRTGDRKFHETEREFIFTDSSFFDVFSFKLLEGNPETCLKEPRSIVLTEEYASKYFGDDNPMGKTFRIEQDSNFYVVTGVMEDIPVNSHIHFKMLGSLCTFEQSRSTNWVNHNFHTYFVLAPGTDPVEFESRMQDMVEKYVGPMVEQFMGINLDQFRESGNSYGYRLQAMTDIHLYSDLQYEMEPGGNPMYVYIFMVVAILILIIASINFMNLATARSTTRAREVGLRKVVGSSRSLLITQFLTESVFLSIFAMIIAVVIVFLLMPGYNNLIRLDLDFDIFSNNWNIPLLILFAIFVGLLAGSYPAFVLAGFKPVAVFKTETKGSASKSFLRNLLIILQFTVTIVILLGTFMVSRQLAFMQKKDPGFDKEKVLIVHRSDGLGQKINAFKEEIGRHSNIINVANSTHVPSYQYWQNAHWLEGWDRSDIFLLSSCYTSYNFDQAMGLEMVEGRFFSPDIPTDSFAVIINEASLKAFDIKDPLNTRFYNPGEDGEPDEFIPIIGVVKDFHFESMQEEIHPMAIHFMIGNWEGVLVVKLGEGNMQETVEFVQQKWEDFGTEHPFEYSWMDDTFNKLFDTERRTGMILVIFSILSVFISCLGLLGLISYTTNQRTKEIGIRKTMGASVNIVMFLLSKETLRLLGISSLIAIPAYFGIRTWLQNFAFHIDFNVIVYALVLLGVTLVVLIVALLTVSYNSYQAATANPAES